MTIDNPWNLDPTSPISNSSFNSVNVAEGMAPSLVNNALRQLSSFLAQATSYKSADISSSASTNIAGTGTGLFMDVTGANAINHFGSPAGAEQPNAAVFRFLQYDSSASVSHGANIKLWGAASRKMQPGSVQGVIHEGSGVWRELFYTSPDGTLPINSISVTSISCLNVSANGTASATQVNAGSISATTLSVASISATAISNFSFMVHKNGSSQTSISASQTITWGTESWDIGGFFAANAWTPPAGKYRLEAQVSWDNPNTATGNFTLNIQKNGTVERGTTHQPNNAPITYTQYISCLVDANGTDAFTVVGSFSGIGLANGNAIKTFFCGERI